MSTPHSRSKLVTITGILLSAALGLTACGNDDGDNADASMEAAQEAPDVDISYEISEETEDVKIEGDLEMDQSAAWLIAEGDGEVIEEGDLLHILSADVDIDNEEINAHDFDLGGQTLQMSEEFKAQNPQAYDTLIGAPAGSDLAYYLPEDTLGQDTPAYLNIIAIENIVPSYATGQPVPPADLSDELPEVTIDKETHAPAIATPEGEAPDDLVVDVLKQGNGPEVQPGSYVTIHYRGIKWSDGEEFDSSWGPENTGAPAQLELQQLIAGWQEGLEGQQVGSQVIMSIPPELGYGETDGHELQDETLVFVIDILHSADPIEAE